MRWRCKFYFRQVRNNILRHLAITLSRSVKIYPVTEKIHVNQASKISYPPRKRSLQARTVITFERASGYLIQNMRFSRCTGGLRKTEIYWSFWYQIRNLSSEKMHVKSVFVFRCLLSCESFGPLLYLRLRLRLRLVYVLEAVPTDKKGKGNAGNSNSRNNSDTILYLFSGPISTGK